MLLSIGRIAERQRHAGSLAPVNAVVDGLAQEVIVSEVRPFRAPGPAAIQGELDRVEEGRLSSPVDAAEQGNGQMSSIAATGCQIEDLLTAEKAEIAKRQLFQDHSSVPIGWDEASTTGSSIGNSAP